MSCRCRCESAAVAASGTTCIDVTGTGTIADPLLISEIIPAGAVVPHPLLPGILPDTINGLVCTPTGLMAPQPGFPSIASGGIGAGSLPDIVADTGPVPWGPILTSTMLNLNTDRDLVALHFVSQPIVNMALESGAFARFGIIFDPSGLAIYLPLWSMSNNSGAALETYVLGVPGGLNLSGLTPAGGSTTIEYQSWVEASGFSGASSVTTLLQAGIEVKQWGMPL